MEIILLVKKNVHLIPKLAMVTLRVHCEPLYSGEV